MSRIKPIQVAGLKIIELAKKLRKRKYAKESKKNVERARGVRMSKSVKAYNIRAKDAETKIIPVKQQSQKGSTFQIHRVRSKMGRAAAQSEEKGKLPSPTPTLDRLFKGDVQRGKLDDYRLTRMYLRNKLSDVAKKKFKGGMMKRKMLTGGQAKLDKNKNNKIDAEDFAILRKEKAKGRGMGLQDEKMKPGKVTKASLGAIALGAMTAAKLKKLKGKKNKMAGAARVMGSNLIPGMSVADIMKRKLRRSKGGGADTGRAGELRSRMGVNINQIQRLARKMKDKDRLTERDIELAGDIVGSVRPYMKGKNAAVDLIKRSIDTLKSSKKMGGGMMRQYTKGGGADMGKAQGRRRPSMKGPMGRLATEKPRKGVMGGGMMKKPMGYDKGGDSFLKRRIKLGRLSVPMMIGMKVVKSAKKLKDKIKPKKKMGGGMMMTPRGAMGAMGGGMMMKPMGYKAGKSVKVKCKIGRNKPTKMY